MNAYRYVALRRIALASTFFAAALLFTASRVFGAQLTYFVATNGNDGWSGRLASPKHNHFDGPFRTIQRAQQAVRARANAQAVTVEIRGGRYEIAQPLVFTSADSGTDVAPVIYTAYLGEHPVISGGTHITNFRADASGSWQAQLPEVKSGVWNFEELFVNGSRRYRPRLPETGYYHITAAVAPSPAFADKGYDRFQFRPGDIDSNWRNIGDVEVLAFHTWSMARMRIAQIDGDHNVVRFTGASPDLSSWASFPAGNRYIIDNVREALHSPGQWYLDRSSGVLTYIPLPGETLPNADIVAPRLSQLVLLQGDPTRRTWVEHITFRGLSFEYGNWVCPAEGHDFPQSDVDLTACFAAVGARHCRLADCTISHVAGYGVSLGAGCRFDMVDHCRVSDVGAGGIKMGEMNLSDDPEAEASNNAVVQTDIFGGGRIFAAGTGVWIGQSYSNTLQSCAIHDFYYTGVSLGWTWGYGRSDAHDNIVSNNDIYQIGQGVLSDMGGIYSVGARAGTLEKHNRIHDIRSFSYGGWGIYFDEGSSDVKAADNLVYDTSAADFHQHYGARNMLTNNIFAFGREAQLMRTRAEDHLSFTLTHNIVLSAGSPMLGSNWSGNQYALDYNDYYVLGGTPVLMNGTGFQAWQATGQDRNSVTTNPGFIDASKRDFHICGRSTIDKIGFVAFDVDHFGPTNRYADRPLPAAFPTTSEQTVNK